MTDCPCCTVGKLLSESYQVLGAEQVKLRCQNCGADLYDEACGRHNRKEMRRAEFEAWAKDNFCQGYSLEREEGPAHQIKPARPALRAFPFEDLAI